MSTGEKIWMHLAKVAQEASGEHPTTELHIGEYTLPIRMFTSSDTFFPAFSEIVDDQLETHPPYQTLSFLNTRHRHKYFAVCSLFLRKDAETVLSILHSLFIIRHGEFYDPAEFGVPAEFDDLHDLIECVLADGLENYPGMLQSFCFEHICISWLRVRKAVRVIAERYREHLLRRRDRMMRTVLIPIIVRQHKR